MLNSIKTVQVYGLLLACIIARPLHASSDLNALYQQWLQVQVEQGEEIQAQTYQQLFSQAEQLRQDYANVAESPFLDPYVFFGNTYAELGSLYFRTPSWPFSFGSEKMAEKLFYKGIYIDPRGLVTNLRFGEYWFAKKDYALASQYLGAATQVISPLKNSLWVSQQNEKTNYLLSKIKQKSRSAQNR